MKKIIFSLTLVAMLGSLLSYGQVKAADGSTLDQSYEVMTTQGYGKVGISGMGQTFKPTQNRITYIDVYFTNRQTGSNITMTIENPATKEKIGSATNTLTFAGDAAWETFGFTPSLVVLPETEYVMYLSSNIDNGTRWMTSGDAPQYSRGFAVIVDKAQESYDRLFRQYGKNVIETSTPTVTSPQTPNKTIAASTNSVVGIVKDPILTYVMNGNKKIEAPFKGDISIAGNTKVVLYGTSFGGAKVTIFIGNTNKLAEIDTSGNWNFTVENSLISDDPTLVAAQAQDSSGKNSNKVEITKLKKAVPGAAVVASEAKKAWYENDIFLEGLLVTALVVLAALLTVLFFLFKRKKQENSHSKATNKVSEETPE